MVEEEILRAARIVEPGGSDEMVAGAGALCAVPGLEWSIAADQDPRDSSIFCWGYLEPDRILEGRTNIYDRNGNRVGELRQDLLLRGRTNIYDQDGRLNGYLEQDRLKMR